MAVDRLWRMKSGLWPGQIANALNINIDQSEEDIFEVETYLEFQLFHHFLLDWYDGLSF